MMDFGGDRIEPSQLFKRLTGFYCMYHHKKPPFHTFKCMCQTLCNMTDSIYKTKKAARSAFFVFGWFYLGKRRRFVQKPSSNSHFLSTGFSVSKTIFRLLCKFTGGMGGLRASFL
jgi:hypothetical protein